MKKVIVVCFMLFLSSFIGKEVAKYKAIKYQDMMNSKIPYEVRIVRHKVWSKIKGVGCYDVFIDYNADNLRLTTIYKVKNGVVTDCYRISE